MEQLELLGASLLELLVELEGTGVALIVGGGYGLFLKRNQASANDQRRLIEDIQQVRSTNDLDLFLGTELLADSGQARHLAEALCRLGFVVVETAKFYQFRKTFTEANQDFTVKIDLLTGPPSSAIDPNNLRIEDSRRIKPRDKTISLHARRTDEAVAIDEALVPVVIQGSRFSGENAQGQVFLPNALSYLLMKLHAFSDKELCGESKNASKHAADVYQVLAVTDEEEWETAKNLQKKFSASAAVKNAHRIVQQQFIKPDQMGIIRLREYSPVLKQANLTEFSLILAELFTQPDY